MKSSLPQFGAIISICVIMLTLGWLNITYHTESGLALDDGYIHLAYARNMRHFHLFQYNIGEASSGSTAPLWVFLIAFTGAVFRLITAAWILSALSYIICAVAAYFLTRQLLLSIGISANMPAMLAGLIIATHGRFFWHTFSGMETQLYCAVAAFSIGFFIMESRFGKPFLTSAVLAGIALWLRPETFFLFLVLLAGYALYTPQWKRIALPSSIMTASTLTYFIFNAALTGSILPNTFFSKNAIFRGNRFDYISYSASIFWNDNFILLLAALLGIVILIYYGIHHGKRYIIIPTLWFLGLPIAKFVVSPQEVGFGRYTIIILPFLSAIACAAIAVLPRKWYRATAAALVLLPGIYILPRWLEMPANTIEQINTIHGETSRWIIENTPDDAIIAAHDVGRIKYDTEREILDIAGLTSNKITKLIWNNRELLTHSFRMYDSIAALIILDNRPDFIAISAAWMPYLAGNRSALKPIWHTSQYENAVECIPEMTIYELLPGADTTLMNFSRHGFRPDIQWVLQNLLPAAIVELQRLENLTPYEKQKYIESLKSANEESYPYLGISLRNIITDLINSGKIEEALIIGIFGCELYPGDAVLWNICGAIFSQMGNFNNAASAFQKCIEIAPEMHNTRINYAIILNKIGNVEAAKAQLDTVLISEPQNGKAKTTMEHFLKSEN